MTLTPADLLRAQIEGMPGAVQAVFGTLTTPAILDFNGQAWGDEGAAQVGGEQITLTYVYPDLPGLAPGAALTAGGESYQVLTYPRRTGDGLEAHVLLEAR